VWHEQILSLGAVYGITKAPAAQSLVSTAVTTLRTLAGQTRAALAARRDRAHEHAITEIVTGYSRTELVNHSYGLVTDDEAALDRILAAENVQIGSADRRQRDPNYRFADPCMWTFNFLNANVVHAMKNSGSHRGISLLILARSLE
jgi:hypothetical protein